jgi:hypothetical protein
LRALNDRAAKKRFGEKELLKNVEDACYECSMPLSPFLSWILFFGIGYSAFQWCFVSMDHSEGI